jgi:hypothetical protein
MDLDPELPTTGAPHAKKSTAPSLTNAWSAIASRSTIAGPDNNNNNNDGAAGHGGLAIMNGTVLRNQLETRNNTMIKIRIEYYTRDITVLKKEIAKQAFYIGMAFQTDKDRASVY